MIFGPTVVQAEGNNILLNGKPVDLNKGALSEGEDKNLLSTCLYAVLYSSRWSNYFFKWWKKLTFCFMIGIAIGDSCHEALKVGCWTFYFRWVHVHMLKKKHTQTWVSTTDRLFFFHRNCSETNSWTCPFSFWSRSLRKYKHCYNCHAQDSMERPKKSLHWFHRWKVMALGR